MRRRVSHLAASLWGGSDPSSSLLPRELRGGGWDGRIVIATVLLTLLGLVMVTSATSVTQSRPAAFFQNHALKLVLGGLAFLAGHRMDYHRWCRWAPGLYLGGLVLLLLVYVPGLGHSAGHARRWLNLGGFTFQPADFARVGLVVHLAFLLSKPRHRLERLGTGLVPGLIALIPVALLVLKQPNLSTGLAMILITAVMLFVGGIPLRHLAPLAALVPVALSVMLLGYQSARVSNWVSYWSGRGELQGGNYQMDQSILAIGSGGLLGRGLGEGHQKWFFLPDAHTDFIFAIVGEELGLMGTLATLGLILFLLWRGYEAARRAPDRFGFLLAVGITASVAVYSGVNFLVATGLFPTTGLPLPLVSYGGSAILTMLFSLGILGNIASQGDSSLLVGIGEQE